MRALVLLALGPTLAGQTLQGRSAPSGFHTMRSVLGYTIEEDTAARAWRLVRDPGTALSKIVLTGTKQSCERRLVDLLVKTYGTGEPNLALPTFGGRQLYADELVFAGWRIQRNVVTKHHRLLDAGNVRRAWGSYRACRVAFEKARLEHGLKLSSPDVVVLVHGLMRSRHCFGELAATLRKAGREVAAIGYPSTRGTTADHAAQLGRVLRRMEGVRRVSFVTHSFGGLVVRKLLADPKALGPIQPVRLVMLGPPNQGSYIANRLEKVLPFKLITGRAGADLVSRKVGALPKPPIPFGVIAGGTGSKKGFNPLIPGDDDGVVAVAHTKLAGMADFLRVRCIHSTLMNNDRAIAATLRFLETGSFRRQRDR